MMAPELLGGRYALRGVLGRGGMAEVRDAWDIRLDRAVAIKLLHPVLSTQVEVRRRFEAEAKSAAALSHPNIVAVHDSGEHDGTPYIVMERLPGRTLADLIACGPLPQSIVRTMLDQVLAALTSAHEAGILHRDIKPGNILFTDSGDAKVADFGIAKTAEVDHTMTGQVVGTIAYLSPDRVAGRRASAGDDLYAVGVVGYEALTGRRPFIQENLAALARAIMDDRPCPVADLRPDVDPLLATVVERAMAREPEWRFANARAMRAALSGDRAALHPAGVRPPTMVLGAPLPATPTFVLPQRNALSRNKKLLVAAAGLIAIAIAAVAFALDATSQRSVPETPAGTTSTLAPPPSISPVTSAPTPTPVKEPDNEKHGGGKGRSHRGGD
jgi:eukaryotic-like serine/threonine-protein kinase